MAVTKNGIIKRVLAYGSLLAVLNQFSPACVTALYYNLKKPAVVDFEMKEKVPMDFGALEYLLMANSFAHNGAKKGYACVEQTEATFHAYQRLARENKRDDLHNKVRLVHGVVDDGFGVGEHAWLQYMGKDGEIQNFEAGSFFIPEAKANSIRWLVKIGRTNKLHARVLRTDMVSGWGSATKIPTADFIFYPGGGLRIAYNHYFIK